MSNVDFLSQVPLFQSLTREHLAEVAALCELKRFQAGDVIFRGGEPSREMYVVETGSVRIFIQLGDPPKDVDLTHLSPGEFFGELALLDGAPRSANAQAVADTTALVLGRDRFLDLVAKRPAVAIAMLGVLSRRLRETDALMRGLASKNVNQEIAERLTFSDRLADAVASFGGSWAFVIVFVATVTAWMLLNTYVMRHHAFDEYPYQFLNLVLAVVAAMQAPFIMMSQNRESAKDRIRSDLDYQVNLKNEITLTDIKEQLDELRRVGIPELTQAQRDRLDELAQRLDALERRVGVDGGGDKGGRSAAGAN